LCDKIPNKKHALCYIDKTLDVVNAKLVIPVLEAWRLRWVTLLIKEHTSRAAKIQGYANKNSKSVFS